MAKTALPETIPLYTPDQQALESLKSKLTDKPWLPLGIYYENLWQFLITQHPDLTLLTHNLQVIQNQQGVKTTLGEYDLIYHTGNRIYHRELAIKFYLGVPLSNTSESPWHQWVGPRLKDRLDRKMQRLCHHQILLSETTEGQQALAAFDSKPVTKEILVQGRLFYPMFAHCPPPAQINPDHLRGYWLTISDYEIWLSKRSAPNSQILKKPFWIDNDDPDAGLSPREHLKVLHQKKQPQMVKHQGQFIFVVPNDWPQKAIRCSQEENPL